MRIGILTFHCAHNYGAILQCYAMQEYLLQEGYEVDVIDYRPDFLVKPYKPFQRYRFSFSKPWRLPYELYREFRYAVPRWLVFEGSIRNLFRLSKGHSHDIIPSCYDVYIFGSDQIWNESIIKGNYSYFGQLSFRKNTKRFIAYAASMEMTGLSDTIKHVCKMSLPMFDSIGVREPNLMELLRPYTDKDIKLVCDPTFLLSNNNWYRITKNVRLGYKYVLFYQVRENERSRKFAEKLADQIGCRLVEVSAWVKRANTTRFDFQLASPSSFLGLIKNAECVVTSSFHGAVFSIIYRRPFYSLKLGDGADSRSELLLKSLGLEHRFIDPSEDVKYEDVNFTLAAGLMEELSTRSKYFIYDAINGDFGKTI